MKRLAIILLALAACKSAPSYPSSTSSASPAVGAVSSRKAVEAFLNAVHAQDLQAMSVIWGTSKGPARQVVDRAQIEKRELIMQCYLSHDKFQILSDTPVKPDQHTLDVALTKGDITRQTTFTTVLGPSNRWYVMSANLEPVRDLCAHS